MKKLGRIPDGGGWRVHGRSEHVKGRGIGYDYVRVAIDDHTRVGYAEVLPDEKGATAAAFRTRAARYFEECGIHRIERVLTDNAFAYRNANAFREGVAELGAVQRFIKPYCLWTSGKAERFNQKTLQTEWPTGRRSPATTNAKTQYAPWLQHYNTERIHTGIEVTPITRASPSRECLYNGGTVAGIN